MTEKEIKVAFPGGFRVNAVYKGMVIATDQPVYAGGEGTAPAPFDLFLASIAACAGHYVLTFCKQRELSTEGIYLTMSMEKGTVSKMVEKIKIVVHLPEDFPDKYVEAAVRSADQCAVKAHIINPPKFEVKAIKG